VLIDNHSIQAEILVHRSTDLLMQFVLTFAGTFTPDEILTNFHHDEISSKVIVLKKKIKKEITIIQHKRFCKHFKEFMRLSNRRRINSVGFIKKLSQKYNNMSGFGSIYNLPQDLAEKLVHAKKTLKEIRGKALKIF
jgi:hypothetical protein